MTPVEALRLRSQGDDRTIPVGGAFIYLQGNMPITDFLGDQLATDQGECLIVDENFQTAIPGVFAAGDVLCKHVEQAAVAASEGIQAAIAVDRSSTGEFRVGGPQSPVSAGVPTSVRREDDLSEDGRACSFQRLLGAGATVAGQASMSFELRSSGFQAECLSLK